tara:strand:- start:2089 stop:3615 length:1527 start_codon:yes stop_codon:yes gene_type:complete
MDKDLITSQQIRDLCQAASEAQKKFSTFSQKKIDEICKAMADTGYRKSVELAKLAVEDTGMGRFEDKITKNEFSTRDLWDIIKKMKTVGVIKEDRRKKVTEFAEPMGIVAGIIPTTNPTSTAMYKIIIALKSGNAIILSPHPRAARCTCAAAEIMKNAALKAGAPPGIIGCITEPSVEAAQRLMQHKFVNVILSTGGRAIVIAAHSSGKPAYGVGPGNVPAFIEKSANVKKAVRDIIAGKSFDNGLICSSEQTMVVEKTIDKKVRDALKNEPVYWINSDEMEKLQKLMFNEKGQLNTSVVGQTPQKIAEIAGFTVNQTIRVLLVELGGVGKEFPFSREKLSPVLGYYVVDDANCGIEVSRKITLFHGVGHTAVIHSNNKDIVRRFSEKVTALRVCVNTPAPHGSVGYSTDLVPAMTLGSGSWGGSITGDNISPMHLINIKRLVWETKPLHSGLGRDRINGESFKRKGRYSQYDDLDSTQRKHLFGSNAMTEKQVESIMDEFSKQRKTV